MAQMISLDSLPDLPQMAVLRRAAARLEAEPDVRAIWLGGSFAAGTADRYSDVDLRIAVDTARMADWRTLDCKAIFGQDQLGKMFLSFGEGSFLHHLLLEDGTIFDLHVQTTERDNPEHAIKILACRDEGFAKRLEGFERPMSAATASAQPAKILDLLTMFWIDSHKHRKVLARGLPMVAAIGVQMERMTLMRLWYILLCGRDSGDRPTIHSLSAATREIQGRMGKAAMELLGMPMRNEQEVCAAIEADRDEVARVGRLLAEREKLVYPQMLEQRVREGWEEIRGKRGM